MDNQFQSRPVSGSPSPEGRGRVPRQGSLRPPVRMRGRMPGVRKAGGGRGDWRRRLEAALAWAQARGRKRLLKDAALAFGGFLVLYIGFLWITLPDVSDESDLIPVQSSVITDRNGIELYRLYDEQDRTAIPSEQIPETMRAAIVAIEDQRFYDRGCLDVQALARAVFRFGRAGGASTLTRQLARNALSLQRHWLLNRKLKELMLGCSLEWQYSKADLLSLYLNWIPFGQNAYGIEQASRRYFGKSTKDITLAESAVLASLPQAPSYYNPYGRHVRTTLSESGQKRFDEGKLRTSRDVRDDDFFIGLLGRSFGSGADALYLGGRTDQVLKNMETQGMITTEQREGALAQLRVMTFQAARDSLRAPHFVLWVRKQVEEMLAGGAEEGFLDQGGLTIRTTLDWKMQQAAEAAVEAKKESYLKLYGAKNIALVAADPSTKEILAYVGNVDYAEGDNDGKVDMALAPRQPGSSFKPFVYAAAFEKGYSPATVIYDVPIKIGPDEPQNFDNGFWGLMNMRRALGASRNTTAAQAFFMAGGEEAVLDFTDRIGVTSPRIMREEARETQPDYSYGWPMALGAADTPLVEMVEGYATLADAGQHAPLVSMLSIKDRRGNIIPLPSDGAQKKEAVDPRVAYEITSVLSDVGARPNEYWQSVLSVPGTVSAAKTGTSNKACPEDERKSGKCRIKPNNLWTMGYTPDIVTGVWVGNADATALSEKAESLVTAAPIWKDFMTRATKLLPNARTAFTKPSSGLVQPQISALSGELPSECTPVDMRKSDLFLQENAPTKNDPACVTAEVDKVTGLLASESCPAEARETRSFFVPQSVLADKFPQWDAAVQAWAARAGTGLVLPLMPKEACDVSKTPERLSKPSIKLQSPPDNGTATYPSFTPVWSVIGNAPREVVYSIDGKPVARITEAPFEGPINIKRSIEEKGTHVLTVTYTDQYYNTATDSVTFRFEQDDTGPRVRIQEPADGDTVQPSSGGILIRAEAEDTEGGLKYVQFYLDGKLLTTKPKPPYEVTYPLPPGDHRIRAEATDFAENKTSDEVVVTVE